MRKKRYNYCPEEKVIILKRILMPGQLTLLVLDE